MSFSGEISHELNPYRYVLLMAFPNTSKHHRRNADEIESRWGLKKIAEEMCFIFLEGKFYIDIPPAPTPISSE